MRVLCSAVALEGHVRPLLPIATSLARAGHQVQFATGPDLHRCIREAGLEPVVAGPGGAEAFATSARMPGLGGETSDTRGVATFSQVIAPAKLPDLERIVADWRPQLIIYEATDMATPVAATSAGIPSVTQGWGLVPLLGVTTPAPAHAAPLWRSRAMHPPAYAGMFGGIHLHPVPPSLQPGASVPIGRLQPMRLEMPVEPDVDFPPWVQDLGSTGRPVVYVGLGTNWYFSRPELIRTILASLEPLQVDVVVTAGEHNDLAGLGVWPVNVHIERWLPLPQLLRQCSVVVCHAGAGTMLASVAAGCPLVVLPRGADQFENAAACVRVGAACRVLPDELGSEPIRRAVERVLADDEFSAAAARLSEEIRCMPAPSDVIPILEHFAGRGQTL